MHTWYKLVMLFVQILLKTCIVLELLPWILWVSWSGNEVKETFKSLFSSLWRFLKGNTAVYCQLWAFFYQIWLSISIFINLFLVLYRYDDASVEYKPYRQKDGALLAIGALCDKLKQTEPYKSELERMLVQHVFPEFSSPVGHLRAKVCDFYFPFFFCVNAVN